MSGAGVDRTPPPPHPPTPGNAGGPLGRLLKSCRQIDRFTVGQADWKQLWGVRGAGEREREREREGERE